MFIPLLTSLASAAWTPLPPVGQPELNTLHALGDTLVTCGRGGCARTSDQGATWEIHRASSVAWPTTIQSGGLLLATDRTEPRTLRLSRDGGRSWSEWNQGIAPDQQITGLDFAQGLAFLVSISSKPRGAVRVLTDTCSWYVRDTSAAIWTRVGTKFSPMSTGACFLASITANRTLHRSRVLEDSSREVFEVSRDNGVDWKEEESMPSRLTSALQPIPRSSGILVSAPSDTAITLDSGRTFQTLRDMDRNPQFLDGAYLSSDPAAPWKDIRSGVRRAILTDSVGTISDWVRIGPVLWVLASKGIFQSTDSGSTWDRALGPNGLSTVQYLTTWNSDIVALARDGSTNRVWRKPQGASQWTPIGHGILYPIQKPLVCGNRLVIPYGETRWGHFRTMEIEEDGSSGFHAWMQRPVVASAGMEWVTLDDSFLVHQSRQDTIIHTRTISADALALSSKGVFAHWDANFTARSSDSSTFTFIPRGTIHPTQPPGMLSLPNTVRLPNALSAESGTPRAWFGTREGLFACTDTKDCRRVRIADTDTLAQIRLVRASGPFVAAVVVPSSRQGDPVYQSARLLASRDTGSTWTELTPPGYVLDAAFTSEGIAVSLSGNGVWLLADPEFATTSVGPRPARATSPILALRGRILSLTGVAPGTVAQVLDASGRTLLQTSLDVRDREASLTLPASARGVLMVRLRSDAGVHTLRTVATGR